MASERMTWDHPTDRDLIGAIADEIAPTQEQLRSVTARLTTLGYSCTVKAVTYWIHTLHHLGIPLISSFAQEPHSLPIIVLTPCL